MKETLALHGDLVSKAAEALRADPAVDNAKIDADMVNQHAETIAQHGLTLAFDTELSEAEQNSIADAGFAEMNLLKIEREAKPHVVHVKPVWVERDNDHWEISAKPKSGEVIQTDADGNQWVNRPVHEKVRMDQSICPDCTRGLSAHICVQAGRISLTPCHEQCIVACGRPR